MEVGQDVTDFKIGDAGAAAGFANHAGYVDVPVNLAAKILSGVNFEEVSTVVLGSTSIHCIPRANLQLKEFCVVFGAGILGLLSLQMLKASIKN